MRRQARFKSAEDPNLGFLGVRIAHTEFWDVKESKMAQRFKVAKAAVTGQERPNLCEHKTLDLR